MRMAHGKGRWPCWPPTVQVRHAPVPSSTCGAYQHKIESGEILVEFDKIDIVGVADR